MEEDKRNEPACKFSSGQHGNAYAAIGGNCWYFPVIATTWRDNYAQAGTGATLFFFLLRIETTQS